MNKILISSIVVVLVVVGGFFLLNQGKSNTEISMFNGVHAIVYKSASCGCCVGFVAESRKLGMDVEMIVTEDMDGIKEKYDIPHEMGSCHTTIIDGYFIEGHMPFEVIEKLLTEKPDIDGIALPGMPAGSPGMPGQKAGPYEVFQLKDGVYSNYISI
jgi:hypothetical protein